jgi:hypothetical protein
VANKLMKQHKKIDEAIKKNLLNLMKSSTRQKVQQLDEKFNWIKN